LKFLIYVMDGERYFSPRTSEYQSTPLIVFSVSKNRICVNMYDMDGLHIFLHSRDSAS